MKLKELKEKLSKWPDSTEVIISDTFGNDKTSFEIVQIKVPNGFAIKIIGDDFQDFTNPEPGLRTWKDCNKESNNEVN